MKSRAFPNAAPFLAYLAAVTTATACLVLLIAMHVLYRGDFESATHNSFSTKASHFAFVMLLLFIAGWIFAFATALVPFTIGWIIASTFAIRSATFFIVGGAITGALIAPFFLSTPFLALGVTRHPHFTASGDVINHSVLLWLRTGSRSCMLENHTPYPSLDDIDDSNMKWMPVTNDNQPVTAVFKYAAWICRCIQTENA
jgi:hypothetical protein